MKKLLLLSACTFMVFTLFKCGQQKDQEEEKEKQGIKESLVPVKKEADRLRDSLQLAWDTLRSSESDKLQRVSRILQEISYIKEHDPVQRKKLKKELDTLQDLQLTQEALKVSDSINYYDSTTNALLDKLKTYIENTPKTEQHVLIENLWTDIQKAENRLIFLRMDYDKKADTLNKFIEAKEEELDSLGKPYKNMNKKGRYTIKPSS